MKPVVNSGRGRFLPPMKGEDRWGLEKTPNRLQIRILGIVQGVGFRPFVYRLAEELELHGWVRNDGNGVTIEAQGRNGDLICFLERVTKEAPAPSFIYALDHRFIEIENESQKFEILESEAADSSTQAWILPDLATCRECRSEIMNPSNRRFRYPFTNCTHCGTRFTIIHAIPYDRPRTSMNEFPMCGLCLHEYHDRDDRRFHAQPNACAECGPALEYVEYGSGISFVGDDALIQAAQSLREGKILAVKGLGGYHLMVDARNEEAVAELRRRKRRQRKPFAVMYPDLNSIRKHVEMPAYAEVLLESYQAPILLLRRTEAGFSEIAYSAAPDSPYLGVFLPYTPLHHLLLHDLGFPVIATSGNISDEPIQFDDNEASVKLSRLRDGFLRHNRKIVHHADDSVIQIIATPDPRFQFLRRARGYTPMPLLSPRPLSPLLALGGHLNSTFALSRNREIILSQHLGDLEGYEPRTIYRKTLDDFLRLYGVKPETVAHDLHPSYFTTFLAEELQLPRIGVQHHHAHLAACLFENQVHDAVLGITWDGTGFGPDHTVWGGEFLEGNARDFRRVASLFPFRLPGNQRAIEEPWRLAVSLLWEAFGEEFPRNLPLFDQIPKRQIELVLDLLRKKINSPVTTSAGRLFDGLSALLGFCLFSTHQAEAAQAVEYAAWHHGVDAHPFSMPLIQSDFLRLDWRHLIREAFNEWEQGVPGSQIAASFHHSLVEGALSVCQEIGRPDVAMAGGVFCNRYLTEMLIRRLKLDGFRPLFHTQLPPTDGSLAVGQLWVAAHRLDT